MFSRFFSGRSISKKSPRFHFFLPIFFVDSKKNTTFAPNFAFSLARVRDVFKVI